VAQKFLYSQRPSKYIERCILADMLRRLEPHIAPLNSYRYVGFGGLEFADFDLFHRELGIIKMISMEKSGASVKRYNFNRPFGGIEVQHGHAKDLLPKLEWNDLNIVWLDYQDNLTSQIVGECQTVLRSIIPGSILMVTLNAGAGSGRQKLLETNLDRNWIPDIKGSDLGKPWGFAQAQHRILAEQLKDTADRRSDSIFLRQFTNIYYQDNARMQTIGWFIGSPGVNAAIDNTRILEHPFARLDDTPAIISLPVLTRREIAYLNTRLPLEETTQLKEAWLLPSPHLQNYAELYRFYPSELAVSQLA
jgi:hypothetical protein